MAANALESSELWRQIPPEEKFEIMARAHACGILTAVALIIIASTVAIGLRMGWMLWASLLLSPLVFQFAAGKAWRDLKPSVMLEYLAARSAARRYAFTTKAKDLDISLIFRARLERIFDEENIEAALDALADNSKERDVWVVLFADSVIMISEHPGGAKAEFAYLINERMKVDAKALDGGGDYSDQKELIITAQKDRRSHPQSVKLISRYPAALVVFERRLKESLAAAAKAREALMAIADAPKVEAEPERSRYDF